jgi:hypothetical protein
MTTHLFEGYVDDSHIVLRSHITTCCKTHALGLPKGDQGSVHSTDCDCPDFEPDGSGS